jgi:DNA-binding beta-propeller fold protein YncE
VLKEIPLAWTGGTELLAMDESGGRLYVVHGGQVEALDVNKDSFVGGITNGADVHGFTLVPQLRRAFMCNGHDPRIEVVDLMRLRTVQPIKTEKVPEAVILGPSHTALYSVNRADQSVSVFEADDGDYVGTVKLGGKPGVAVADAKSSLVYCALEDPKQLVVIDAGKRVITNQWDILPKEGLSAIAVDSLRHRLFLGGRNQTVVMVDSLKGTVLGGMGASGQVDGIAVDGANGRLLVSAGGTLTVAEEYAMNELKMLQTLELRKERLLIAFYPKTRKIYLTAAGPGASASSGSIIVCGQ